MDFKIVDSEGKIVAMASSAREAREKVRTMLSYSGSMVFLDDTGAEVSQDDLDVFCLAEETGGRMKS